jgi:hypothetical protein
VSKNSKPNSKSDFQIKPIQSTAGAIESITLISFQLQGALLMPK